MIIYSNDNNTSTLKLLIAAKLAGQSVELKNAKLTEDLFDGPRQFPLLVVNEDLKIFSSNAATLYFLPVGAELRIPSSQHFESEATRLYPASVAYISSPKSAPDVKQLLFGLLQDIDKNIGKKPFILSSEISAVDVSIWSTIYYVLKKEEIASALKEQKNLLDWFDRIEKLKAVQGALEQWKGTNASGNSQASNLGPPPIVTLSSPLTSPDEGAVVGLTSDEIQKAEDGWNSGNDKIPVARPKESIVLPKKDRKNILITSALPYVNNVPHLGNIIGCVLSADIFARYCRVCDYNTLFVCGTDEYGTATETKALEENLTPRQICDKYFEIHNAVYRWFGIGFDTFGRTTTSEQTEIAQDMFLKLKSNGFIESQPVEQLLCPKCNRFLADRFVEGICPLPNCGYDGARGDQCDKCGKLVTATELLSPRCKLCAATPVLTNSTQFFLDLPQLEPSLRSFFSQREASWSPSARAVTKAWLRDGLRARCITRDLDWGVPVPLEGFTKKVFYVWFDAPIGYLSITKRYTDQYEQWWKPQPEHDVKLYQFMAKDNVPFHGIMFPATLLGVNQGHILVHHIMATEYLNYEEGKFSKSRGVGVFGTDAQETGIPADVWRFYLASIRPEGQDSSFSWVELFTKNNSELLNNLGNFCHRSLSFCGSVFEGIVPEICPQASDFELIAHVNRETSAYVQHMEKGRLREALKHVLSISRLGNQHMQAQQPWVLAKGSDGDKLLARNCIGLCCQLVALLATLLAPFMPETSRRLSDQLNIDINALRINPEHPEMRRFLPSGHVLGKSEPLFTKLDTERIEVLRAKYAGTQDQRKTRESAGKASGNTVGGSVQEMEDAVTKQGEKVRSLKQSGAEKAVWQPEVAILLQLKKQLEEAKKKPVTATAATVAGDVNVLEDEVAKQGEKVRALKQSGAEKAVWQPEVAILLKLKKQLEEAKKKPATATAAVDVKILEDDVAKQGEKVRALKQSGAQKTVWQPEVTILLELKKKLAAAQEQEKAQGKPAQENLSATNQLDVKKLEEEIAKQGEKVRALKLSTKDKSVWQPAVDVLLNLKKQLATRQSAINNK